MLTTGVPNVRGPATALAMRFPVGGHPGYRFRSENFMWERCRALNFIEHRKRSE